MINIGVLGLQGSVDEHIKSLGLIDNVQPLRVKTIHDLELVAGLIIPGGESTTIGKLLRDFKLADPIIKRVKEGMPLWGTCAGMVLMAKTIINEDYVHLGIMDISVRRNAYGSQSESFTCSLDIPQLSIKDFPLVFIRAPWIEKVGKGVEVLATINNRIVAVKQRNLLATSFHPELTTNIAFHKLFIKLVENHIRSTTNLSLA